MKVAVICANGQLGSDKVPSKATNFRISLTVVASVVYTLFTNTKKYDNLVPVLYVKNKGLIARNQYIEMN